jgi:RNA polymerase sigma-70 factor, ECF subfamily
MSMSQQTIEPSTLGLAKILSGIACGDHGAWTWFCDHHAERIWRLAFAIHRNRVDADDACQEIALRVRRHAAKFNARAGSDAYAEAWVRRLAVNCCLDRIRAMMTRSKIETRPKNIDSVQSSAKAQIDVLANKELCLVAMQELASLSDRDRYLIGTHIIDGIDQVSLADELSCRVETLRVRLHRALERLRRALDKRGISLTAAFLIALLTGAAADTAEIDQELIHRLRTTVVRKSALSPLLLRLSALALAGCGLLSLVVLRGNMLTEEYESERTAGEDSPEARTQYLAHVASPTAPSQVEVEDRHVIDDCVNISFGPIGPGNKIDQQRTITLQPLLIEWHSNDPNTGWFGSAIIVSSFYSKDDEAIMRPIAGGPILKSTDTLAIIKTISQGEAEQTWIVAAIITRRMLGTHKAMLVRVSDIADAIAQYGQSDWGCSLTHYANMTTYRTGHGGNESSTGFASSGGEIIFSADDVKQLCAPRLSN